MVRRERREAPLVEAVLGWWQGARVERDALPWRSSPEPWAVLVSEAMLVQTQIARVEERFGPFLERYPDPKALADAPLAEVVRAWSGLGYNRRAAWLHAAARRIVAEHGGVVPSELDVLLALPGVGSYSARAIRAFAFEQPAAVVETNVGRVLARAVAGERLASRAAQELADSLVPSGRSRAWNLALIDLGALCCRARSPRCATCPLAKGLCAWRASGAREDPAAGSAGVARRQGTFAGSDREGRGRLVRAACKGPVPADELAAVTGFAGDPARALALASRLVLEGLLSFDDAARTYLLAGDSASRAPLAGTIAPR